MSDAQVWVHLSIQSVLRAAQADEVVIVLGNEKDDNSREDLCVRTLYFLESGLHRVRAVE